MHISECSLEAAGQEEGQAFFVRLVRRSKEEGGAPAALALGG